MSPAEKPPYLPTPSLIPKVLDKIKQASTPERFTQDFLHNKLTLKGGSADMLIPYLKKVGFLNTDGSPTEIYARFRNDSLSGEAVADALTTGYKALFEVNEKAQELNDNDLKGLIVQVTGQGKDDSVTKFIFQCFKALKAKAVFSKAAKVIKPEGDPETPLVVIPERKRTGESVIKSDGIGMNLSYTINLNLPSTTDIAVFNAIFQSLRKNLLRDE